MIEQDHPFFFLAKILSEERAVFHLSKYTYTPDSLFDEREYVSISAKEFTAEWVERAIGSLGPGQELAVHSKVLIKNRTFHIPMIDFSLEEALTAKVVDRMRCFLPRAVMLNLAIYESGRSYHAYSTALLPPKSWIEFMGRMLLINSKHNLDVIDSRWIGHRLIGGYSSLRWSNNTNQYLGMPKRVTLP